MPFEIFQRKRDVASPLVEKRIELDLDNGNKVKYGKLLACTGEGEGVERLNIPQVADRSYLSEAIIVGLVLRNKSHGR